MAQCGVLPPLPRSLRHLLAAASRAFNLSVPHGPVGLRLRRARASNACTWLVIDGTVDGSAAAARVRMARARRARPRRANVPQPGRSLVVARGKQSAKGARAHHVRPRMIRVGASVDQHADNLAVTDVCCDV